MQTRAFTFLLLAASSAPALFGDVTVRSRNTIRFGAIIPAPVAERTSNGNLATVPESTVRYRKGSREYLKSGKFACLLDFGKQKITIIDAGNKTFATVAMKDYGDRLARAMPGVPQEFRDAQQSAKTTLSSRKTGRTDVIQGVPVEETEIAVSLELPVPTADGKIRTEPVVKVAIQVWMAKPAKAPPIPAVRELTAHSMSNPRFSQWIDPANILVTVFGAMPGLGDGLSQMFQEVEKSKSPVFKWHMEASMPGMAAALQNMQKQQGRALPDGLDPNAPFSVVDSEVVELSTAPVDDAVFQVPADYHAAPFEDVVKSVSPSFPKS